MKKLVTFSAESFVSFIAFCFVIMALGASFHQITFAPPEYKFFCCSWNLSYEDFPGYFSFFPFTGPLVLMNEYDNVHYDYYAISNYAYPTFMGWKKCSGEIKWKKVGDVHLFFIQRSTESKLELINRTCD